jgi:hypothetical protein
MEPDPNGINFSDTILKLEYSTTREVRFLISRITRIKKESMLEPMITRKIEFNKDGISDMKIVCLRKLRKDKEAEDSRLENHSTSNQDCGWKELSLITPTTMLTSLPENHNSTRDKLGYMMKLQRPSSLTIP